jgi:EpsD family peptidyl-prolyl cis-trans isomerase
MYANKVPKLLPPLISALIVVSLAACGDDKAGAKAAATQVAAKVNGAEISVHQINGMLTKATGVTNENAPRARKEILDRLVDQQLAVEQAMAKKLDRNPEVLLNLEAARREILARSYLEQIAAAQPKATDEEIKRYYDEHPDLFSKRRIYNIQELDIPKNADSQELLKEYVSSGKSLEEIATWLKSKNIPARGSAGTRPAEQLPIELLPQLAKIKDGQTSLIEGPQMLYVMRVIASQSAPVDEAAAKPRIQQFLQNQRNVKAVGEEMKKLKETAKIEYVGDFATLAAAPANTPAPTVAPPAAATTSTLDAPSQDKKSNSNATNAIEKGIAGLK